MKTFTSNGNHSNGMVYSSDSRPVYYTPIAYIKDAAVWLLTVALASGTVYVVIKFVL